MTELMKNGPDKRTVPEEGATGLLFQPAPAPHVKPATTPPPPLPPPVAGGANPQPRPKPKPEPAAEQATPAAEPDSSSVSILTDLSAAEAPMPQGETSGGETEPACSPMDASDFELEREDDLTDTGPLDDFLEYDNVEALLRRYRQKFLMLHAQTVRAAITYRAEHSARLLFSDSRMYAGNLATESPFAHMGEASGGGDGVPSETADDAEEGTVVITNELLVGSAGRTAKMTARYNVKRIQQDSITLPDFAFYTTMDANRFSEGSNELTYWPYFRTDNQTHGVVSQGLYDDLGHMFISLCDGRTRLLKLQEHVRTQEPFLDHFMADVGCDWADVMRELLRFSAAECRRKAYLETIKREDYCHEDFAREAHRWRPYVSRLPKPSNPERARQVASLVCSAHLAVYGISIWPIVRRKIPLERLQVGISVDELWPGPRDEAGRDGGEDGDADDTDSNLDAISFGGLACRVCHMHFCTSHGSFAPDPDPARPAIGWECDSRLILDGVDSNAGESSLASSDSDDGICTDPDADDDRGIYGVSKYALSYHPSTRSARLNQRLRVSAVDLTEPDSEAVAEAPLQQQPARRRKTKLSYTERANGTMFLHRRPAFLPCSHPGRCEDARCSCFTAGVLCEKYCRCMEDCDYRYRGCNCHTGVNPRPKGSTGDSSTSHSASEDGEGVPVPTSAGMSRSTTRPCYLNSRCTCFSMNRECDPDLCHSCGVLEALDPAFRHFPPQPHLCANVHMQRDRPARTLVGASIVHGLGLFAAEPIPEGAYLGEYKGELVSRQESDRRGVVYHYNALVYLFTLNKEQDVDSAQFGNKLRFVNHASKPDNTNVQPRVFYYSGSFHIGMFAKRDIQPSEELFFNYGYPPERKKGFLEPGEDGSEGERQVRKRPRGILGGTYVGQPSITSSRNSNSRPPAGSSRRRRRQGGTSRPKGKAVRGKVDVAVGTQQAETSESKSTVLKPPEGEDCIPREVSPKREPLEEAPARLDSPDPYELFLGKKEPPLVNKDDENPQAENNRTASPEVVFEESRHTVTVPSINLTRPRPVFASIEGLEIEMDGDDDDDLPTVARAQKSLLPEVSNTGNLTDISNSSAGDEEHKSTTSASESDVLDNQLNREFGETQTENRRLSSHKSKKSISTPSISRSLTTSTNTPFKSPSRGASAVLPSLRVTIPGKKKEVRAERNDVEMKTPRE